MGENILIVHGGGPTSVINASLYGAVKEAKKYKEIEHIYAAKNGTGGLMREEVDGADAVPLRNAEDAVHSGLNPDAVRPDVAIRIFVSLRLH